MERLEKRTSDATVNVDEIAIDKTILNIKDIPELLIDIKNEPAAFKIIQHFADQFDLKPDKGQFVMNRTTIEPIEEKFYLSLNEIIKKAGLIGV